MHAPYLPIGGSPSVRHMMRAWHLSSTIVSLVGHAVQEGFPARSTPQHTSPSLRPKSFASLPTATASRLPNTTAESGRRYPVAMLRCWATSNLASRSQSTPAQICRYAWWTIGAYSASLLPMLRTPSRSVTLAVGSVGFVILAFAVVAYSSVIALALLVASIVCGVLLLRSSPSGRPSNMTRRGIAILLGLLAVWIGLLIVFFTLSPSV